MIKPTIDVATWQACDLRVGTVVEVRPAENLRNNAWVMKIDFGQDVGIRTSVGQFANYSAEEITGAQVIGVVNLPPKKVGAYVSEALTLGVGLTADKNDGHKRLTIDGEARNGAEVG